MVSAMPVSIITIVAFIGFLLLSARKFWKYSRMSKHSRFDLYPVPKEGAEKAKYGGSYFEEPEWWNKERTISRSTENKDIMKEMFLIKKLHDHQHALWWPSFLFHMGIYFLFGWSVLVLIGGFWHPAGMVYFTYGVGVFGFTIATVGVFMLLMHRLNDKAARVYTTPAEFFNLLLILLVLTTGIFVWLTYSSPLVVAYGVFTLSLTQMPILLAIHLILLDFMLLYIPVSKMGHYAGKFFSFRSVLWDNDPNVPGSKVDRNVRESAAHAPQGQWSAHMPADTKSDQEG